MRLPILSTLLIVAAVAGGSPVASAQSPTSYPWCAKTGKDSAATSCYFTSYRQCMTTISGDRRLLLSKPVLPRLARRPAPPLTKRACLVPSQG